MMAYFLKFFFQMVLSSLYSDELVFDGIVFFNGFYIAQKLFDFLFKFF